MTLTNAQIINIINGINTSKELVENNFPIKFAWAFQKNVKAISALGDMINEKMRNIESKYIDDEHSMDITEKNAEGEEVKNRVVRPEFAEEFTKERMEFLNLENEVEIQKFKVEDLGDIKVSLTTINALDFMLE